MLLRINKRKKVESMLGNMLKDRLVVLFSSGVGSMILKEVFNIQRYHT